MPQENAANNYQSASVIDTEPKQYENPFKVRLDDRRGGRVGFDVTPDLSETRNVNYNSLEPIHMPGSIQVFKNSSSRTFQISGARMLSRTPKEAERTIKRLWVLRSWGTPRFGAGSSTLNMDEETARIFRATDPDGFLKAQKQATLDPQEGARNWRTGAEQIGAPPQVLFLSAYSRPGISSPQHLHNIPTVLTNLTIPYPADVDYVLTSAGVPVPIVMSIDLSLTETHSPNMYERFSLGAYKRGLMPGF